MKKHLERLMLLACLLMSMGLAHGQTLPVLNMGYVHECVVFQSCSCLGSSGVRGNISSPVRLGKPVLSVVEGIKMEVGFEATTITPSLTLPHRGGENRMAA